MANEIIQNRYVLQDILGQGGMGAVYRAQDRLTGGLVALKRVLVSVDDFVFTSFSSYTDPRLLLAQEFETLASLRHPHIITVLDYGFDDQQQPFFTMSLLEAPQTLRQAASQTTLAGQVALLIPILQALAYLHRRGVVHRDLKPANVLVDAAGQVKVLDFGLALKRAYDKTPVGTLAYMAPEILQGQGASFSSDLYALGMIAYSFFAKEHPFDTTTIQRLMDDILHREPDWEKLPLSLRPIVRQLLSKDPAKRYDDADEVIRALCVAMEQPVPPESSAIRESFLQAADFVGREVEFEQVSVALSHAIQGYGGAWLIGGESGVGKSRFVNELSTQALVWGAVVLRGQAVQSGSLPYQAWREPLRRLCLAGGLTDLEAGVLKELVPDLEDLLGRKIPPLQSLEGTSGQQRLISTILDILKRQTRPILLIVEDLHWAFSSLAPLQQLSEAVERLPLLVVGTYRHDERPDLPQILTDYHPLMLERLSAGAIAELSESMLGVAGKQPQVVDFLRQETEGNVFFLVEVVRVLAEEAGSLAQIGSTALPSSIWAGGIQAIVQRRLDQVPEWGQLLLKWSAVIGRQVELTLLEELSYYPPILLESWLLLCSNAAVLAVQDGVWRFAHDKLREHLLAGLTAEETARLHGEVAATIERIYPDEPNYIFTLVQHWGAAGVVTKEAHYARLAGDRSMIVNLYAAAQNYYTRALVMETDPIQRAYMTSRLGECFRLQGNLEAAQQTLAEALPLFEALQDTSGQAKTLYELAQAEILAGELESAKNHLTHALSLTENGSDQLMLGWVSYGMADILWRTQGDIEAIRTHLGLADQIAKALGNAQLHLGVLGRKSMVADLTEGHEAALSFLVQAYDLAVEMGNEEREAYAVMNIGANYWYLGDFDKAIDSYTKASLLYRRLNNAVYLGLALVNTGLVYLRMQDLPKAESYFQEALAVLLKAKSNLYILLVVIGMGIVRILHGEQAAGLAWLGLAKYHPAFHSAVKDDLDFMLEWLQTIIPRETLEAGMEAGKDLDLDAVIAEIQARSFSEKSD